MELNVRAGNPSQREGTTHKVPKAVLGTARQTTSVHTRYYRTFAQGSGRIASRFNLTHLPRTRFPRNMGASSRRSPARIPSIPESLPSQNTVESLATTILSSVTTLPVFTDAVNHCVSRTLSIQPCRNRTFWNPTSCAFSLKH